MTTMAAASSICPTQVGTGPPVDQLTMPRPSAPAMNRSALTSNQRKQRWRAAVSAFRQPSQTLAALAIVLAARRLTNPTYSGPLGSEKREYVSLPGGLDAIWLQR